VILIAHRLNSIQNADTVYYLAEGVIKASGSFSELVQSNDTVRNLADLMAIRPTDVKDL
jgi:ABC-type multidrug transport system fused ATPase/permease subunit